MKKGTIRKLVLSKETLRLLNLALGGESAGVGPGIDVQEPSVTLCNSYCSGGPGC